MLNDYFDDNNNDEVIFDSAAISITENANESIN